MNVEQIMTKSVDACQPQDTLDAAARIMLEKDCGAVPVLSGDGGSRVAGVVTDRDICLTAYRRGKRLDEIRIEDCMEKEVACCTPGDSIERAEQIMCEARVRRLPVIDEQRQLVGMLSLADIAREVAREKGRPEREVTEAEVSETLASLSEPGQKTAPQAT